MAAPPLHDIGRSDLLWLSEAGAAGQEWWLLGDHR